METPTRDCPMCRKSISWSAGIVPSERCNCSLVEFWITIGDGPQKRPVINDRVFHFDVEQVNELRDRLYFGAIDRYTDFVGSMPTSSFDKLIAFHKLLYGNKTISDTSTRTTAT